MHHILMASVTKIQIYAQGLTSANFRIFHSRVTERITIFASDVK